MLWFTRGTFTKPVLIVAFVAALLFAARSPAQEQPPPTPAADAIPVELYTEPHPKHISTPDCSLGSRISDAAGCGTLNSGKGGWASISFMVDTSGKPFEVTVSRSTGNKDLDLMAQKSIEASTFEPGSLNGKPVESGFVMKYKFWQGPWARPGAQSGFVKGYAALRRDIDAGDRAAADEAFKKLVVTNLYEDAYFGMATYFYAEKWGTEKQQLQGLERGIAAEDKQVHILPRDLFKAALQESMRLQLQARLYAEALDTYKRLQAEGFNDNSNTQYRSAVEKLQKVRSDDSSYVVSGEMPEGEWFLHLFKRHFRAEVTDGYISQVKLRCQKHYISFVFDAKLSYDVASKDGDCYMEMIGAPGSHFALVQF